MKGNYLQIRFNDSNSIFAFFNECWQKTSIAFVVLFLFASFLFLGGLGKRDLDYGDEPRVAGITAEMARTGDFVVPRLNGRIFLEKPPLYFWASSIAFRLLGENNYSARIISALAALGGVIIVFFLARAMKMSITGAFMSGFVLATSVEYWSVGRTCLIDMTLCFFITASIASFYLLINSEVKRYIWFPVFVLSLGCAILTKGLVGFAIPISAIGFYLIVKKDFSFKHWLMLVIGIALSCIPYSIWLLLLYNNLGKDAVYETFWTNNFGRFTGGYAQHICPFYYYLKKFPGQFLPWMLFLPLAGYFLIRDIRKSDKAKPLLFIFSWFVIPFVLLSISAGKRSIYLVPLYPAAALIVGYCFDLILTGKEKVTGWFDVPSSILAGIALLAPLIFLGIRLYYQQFFILLVLITIIGFSLGIYLFYMLRKKEFNFFFKVLLPSFLLIFLTFDMAITPIFNQKESYEPMFDYVKQLMSEDIQFSLLQPTESLDGAAVFYLGQDIKDFNDYDVAYNFIQNTEKAMIIADQKIVKRVQDINIIKDFRIDKKIFIIFKAKILSGKINEKAMDSDYYNRNSKYSIVVNSK